jgi:hypothetical protein
MQSAVTHGKTSTHWLCTHVWHPGLLDGAAISSGCGPPGGQEGPLKGEPLLLPSLLLPLLPLPQDAAVAVTTNHVQATIAEEAAAHVNLSRRTWAIPISADPQNRPFRAGDLINR